MQNDLFDDMQESELRFRATFNNSAIGIVLAGLDGMPRMVNPAIMQITGYGEQELLHLSGLELSYPDDRDLASAPMMELLDGRRETF